MASSPGEELASDPEELEVIATDVREFLAGRVSRADRSGVVVEIGGGLSAAVTTMLAVDALGRERVYGLLLPAYMSAEADARTAELVAEGLGIDYETVQLLPFVHLFRELSAPEVDRPEGVRAMENAVDRMRAAAAYYAANTMDRLVLGTESRTEWLLGTATKYGVRRGDLLPLGHLYRTEVRNLADHIGIPVGVYDRPLGERRPVEGVEVDGPTVDAVLGRLVDEDVGIARAAEELGVDERAVQALAERHARSRHMRAPPPTPATPTDDWYERFHEVELRFD